MSGRMQWNEAGAREASARVASMADAVQVQSRRLAAIAVSQGDATGMIRDLLGTWTTEQWNSELDQFYTFVKDWKKKRNTKSHYGRFLPRDMNHIFWFNK